MTGTDHFNTYHPSLEDTKNMGGQMRVHSLSVSLSSGSILPFYTPVFIVLREVNVSLFSASISSTLLSRAASFEYNEAPVASHYRHGQVDRGH